MSGVKQKRMAYAAGFVVFFMIELLIALFVRDRFIRPYAGDMLVVILVYCFVRIAVPEKYPLMPLYVFLFACFIEGMQYFQIVKVLGLEQNRILRTIIGSVFDWKDIACYGAGAVLLGIYEVMCRRKGNGSKH